MGLLFSQDLIWEKIRNNSRDANGIYQSHQLIRRTTFKIRAKIAFDRARFLNNEAALTWADLSRDLKIANDWQYHSTNAEDARRGSIRIEWRDRGRPRKAKLFYAPEIWGCWQGSSATSTQRTRDFDLATQVVRLGNANPLRLLELDSVGGCEIWSPSSHKVRS